MSFEKYTTLSVEETLKDLNTTKEQGLLDAVVFNLHQKFGNNDLTKRDINGWNILLRQFKSAFIYLLIGASLITFLFSEYVDGILIILFVLINVSLGFFQEYRSEQTVRMLKKYTERRAKVTRNGNNYTIPSIELVPGDIVSFETGDIVPADLRIIEANNLLIDESVLTGESQQIRKTSEKLLNTKTDLYKASNIAFSGTTVVEGFGIGVVLSIGKDTQLGKIAKLATEVQEYSLFEKQINKFSKFILILTAITLVLVFIVQVFFKNTLSVVNLIIFSVALAVGVIPEAMPLVTTFSLSLGASKLAKKKVIIKRLSSIEDLGGIQVLCTDKTGTITENKLSVSDIYSSLPDETIRLGILAASSNKENNFSNAFDLALLDKLIESTRSELSKATKIFEIPFNPTRRRSSVLISYKKTKEIIVRGAVEAIMPYVKDKKQSKDIKLMNWVLQQGKDGKRIIAIAKKNFKNNDYTVKDEEKDLEFVGLVSFVDPIKKTAYSAIQKAKELGIGVKILTGDSSEVAGFVGMKIGISQKDTDVLTGDEFDKLTLFKQKEAIKNINVFARMSPEQKYKFIKLLQEDLEVGFLGEGINDAPALKAAGVSLVVDNASDVAREVADIILLKHDLYVIVDGIELGRKTLINVTNYIKTTLASNFGNFYAMAFVSLVIDFLPMLPIQILLLNLLSDFPMIGIATDNVDEKDVTVLKNHSFKELVLLATLLGLVSTIFDFILFGVFKDRGEGSLQTYWFIGSTLTELALIYSVRTRGWFFKVRNIPSKEIIALTAFAALFAVFVPFTVFGDSIFKFIKPEANQLFIVFGIVATYLLSTEFVKRVYYKYSNVS